MSWRGNNNRVIGWNKSIHLANPRPPAVPATLSLTLEEYFAAAAVMGVLSAQVDEPDHKWACEWALDFGEKMAQAARKRRARRQRDTPK